MRRIRLGRTGIEVPAIGFGTWAHGGPGEEDGSPVGWTGNDDDLSRRALLRGWELGLTHWDTADVYGDGHAEELIGSLWDRVPRDDVFLASKVGWDRGGYDHYYDPRMMRHNFERSLRLLATDHIDLYYLHHCDFGPDDRYLDDALDLLHRYRDEGKIRFIGLSDWSSSAVARLAPRVDPDVVQPYRNLVDDSYRKSGLQAWVEDHDAGVCFFSPLKHGLLLGKYDQPVEFPAGDFRSRIAEFSDPAALERLRHGAEAARQRFADHPQPVLHAAVDALLTGCANAAVLLGMRNPRHVEAAASLGEALSADELAAVREGFAISRG
jgi:aryl-alcohol dehydrogenase-like predicted oxidoreductase